MLILHLVEKLTSLIFVFCSFNAHFPCLRRAFSFSLPFCNSLFKRRKTNPSFQLLSTPFLLFDRLLSTRFLLFETSVQLLVTILQFPSQELTFSIPSANINSKFLRRCCNLSESVPRSFVRDGRFVSNVIRRLPPCSTPALSTYSSAPAGSASFGVIASGLP
jgi:hypothetical protein